jgi:ubiquitin-conjugating enzyme E2 M
LSADRNAWLCCRRSFIQFLFLEPNASDPLNKEAAEVLKNDRNLFKRYVRDAIDGKTIQGVAYDRVKK